MKISGFHIKKYRAKVKDHSWQTTSPEPVSADGYKIVEGYVSIASVILNDDEPSKPNFILVFVSEEINFWKMSSSGFGQTVFSPVVYGENEFEIIGDVE